ncbi:MAG: hypothetical protein KBH05_01680 [Nitrospira sp.]|jgi:hypothetical protein|uniref:hypothetical protein n=1 Tax=Nitrospira sp. ND1 TaxID=1658518 RepID=UPI0009B9A06E|nr:hypothetical protein [Nitrospira sp. ND1]MBP8825160.1 hypothetical protein [Nitrospira sp.]SLM44968.1 hypothetical protein NSND_62401 [Nitrospira sp. ND1]HRC24490.1 hypothetical protein [Nitrospira sp.]
MIGIGARHRVRALILATLFSLSYAAISDGKIVEEDLETMVHESKLIVLGKVASAEFTGEILTDEFKIGKWNLFKAVIKPDLVIKGRLQQDELDLYCIGGMSTEARFNVNDASIFFVDEDDQGRLATVRGYAGKVDITQQVAMPVAIRNEENPQPLDAFMEKIRSIVQVGRVSMVKKEDAIKIANKEVEKLGIDLRDLEIEVDKGNRQWDEFMSILRESGEATREQYQRYQSRLKGRIFWTIFYSPKRIDGRRPKGGDATVLIDARSGEVLIVIRGE